MYLGVHTLYALYYCCEYNNNAPPGLRKGIYQIRCAYTLTEIKKKNMVTFCYVFFFLFCVVQNYVFKLRGKVFPARHFNR